jgi:hypothetical protein
MMTETIMRARFFQMTERRWAAIRLTQKPADKQRFEKVKKAVIQRYGAGAYDDFVKKYIIDDTLLFIAHGDLDRNQAEQLLRRHPRYATLLLLTWHYNLRLITDGTATPADAAVLAAAEQAGETYGPPHLAHKYFTVLQTSDSDGLCWNPSAGISANARLRLRYLAQKAPTRESEE